MGDLFTRRSWLRSDIEKTARTSQAFGFNFKLTHYRGLTYGLKSPQPTNHVSFAEHDSLDS